MMVGRAQVSILLLWPVIMLCTSLHSLGSCCCIKHVLVPDFGVDFHLLHWHVETGAHK